MSALGATWVLQEYVGRNPGRPRLLYLRVLGFLLLDEMRRLRERSYKPDVPPSPFCLHMAGQYQYLRITFLCRPRSRSSDLKTRTLGRSQIQRNCCDVPSGSCGAFHSHSRDDDHTGSRRRCSTQNLCPEVPPVSSSPEVTRLAQSVIMHGTSNAHQIGVPGSFHDQRRVSKHWSRHLSPSPRGWSGDKTRQTVTWTNRRSFVGLTPVVPHSRIFLLCLPQDEVVLSMIPDVRHRGSRRYI